MDPITHGLIGISISTLSGHSLQLNDPLLLGCTIGAVIPDLDIVTYYKGRLNYLLKHRGASHSILALAGMSAAVALFLYLLFPATSWATIFLWTFIGALSHGLSDLLNSYGAELFWPFIKKKYTINMIMLTDPVIFLVFLTTFISTLKFPGQLVLLNSMAFIISIIYLIIKVSLRIKTQRKLVRLYNLSDQDEIKVLPAMYRPFNWNFLIIRSTLTQFGTIRHGNPVVLRSLPAEQEENPSLTTAMNGNLADVFEKFTPYYHVVRIDHEDETEFEFLDLRYWTRNDFFYTGKVIVAGDGKITEEMFVLKSEQENLLPEH